MSAHVMNLKELTDFRIGPKSDIRRHYLRDRAIHIDNWWWFLETCISPV